MALLLHSGLLCLLLFALSLLLERFGPALLLGFILLSFLLVSLPPLLGLFLFRLRALAAGWSGILGQTRGRAGVANHTVVVVYTAMVAPARLP